MVPECNENVRTRQTHIKFNVSNKWCYLQSYNLYSSYVTALQYSDCTDKHQPSESTVTITESVLQSLVTAFLIYTLENFTST